MFVCCFVCMGIYLCVCMYMSHIHKYICMCGYVHAFIYISPPELCDYANAQKHA